MFTRPALSVLIVLLLVVAAGCGSRSSGDQPDAAVEAVATTTQVADIVREVGGDRVAVTQLLKPNSDPHDYEPRPSDARATESADLVFRSGGELDEWTDDLTESREGRTVDLIRAVRTRGDDPHWWQAPPNAGRAANAIAKALAKEDPDGAAGYRARADAYKNRLRALDMRVGRCLEQLPRNQRKLVTTHDALGYYTDRYALELVGAVIPSTSTQAQPSSKAVNRLVRQIRRERVRAIFPESALNPKIEKAVARESGARVGDPLWADTLGPKGSKGATYIGSIEDNTDSIVRGLSGGKDRCR